MDFQLAMDGSSISLLSHSHIRNHTGGTASDKSFSVLPEDNLTLSRSRDPATNGLPPKPQLPPNICSVFSVLGHRLEPCLLNKACGAPLCRISQESCEAKLEIASQY